MMPNYTGWAFRVVALPLFAAWVLITRVIQLLLNVGLGIFQAVDWWSRKFLRDD